MNAMTQKESKAAEILQQAAGHMIDRASTYDNENGERSIPATVEAFNAITDHELTAEQGWLFMVILKLVRSQQGDYKADNYEDSAAYAALMGEQAESDRSVSGEHFGRTLLESVKQMDDMLSAGPDSVDWSKAPRGSTHYAAGRVDTIWYMLRDGKWHVYNSIGSRWAEFIGEPSREVFAVRPSHIDWDAAEKRMDPIGQNGNDGEHYPEIGDHLPGHGGYLIGFIDGHGIVMSETEFVGVSYDKALKAVSDFNDYVSPEELADWRVPTKDELNLAWVSRDKLAGLGMVEVLYWSSAEYPPGDAWCQSFFSGNQYYSNKTGSYRARPVRSVPIAELVREKS